MQHALLTDRPIYARRVMVYGVDHELIHARKWNWETQMATLAFSYRFGEYREKKPGISDGNEGGGEDGF